MTPSALAQTKQYEFDQEKEVIYKLYYKYVLMCAVWFFKDICLFEFSQ